MQPEVYIKGNKIFRAIYFGFFIYIIVLHNINSWLIDKITTDHISYWWPSAVSFFMLWPLAIYSLYVDLKAYPFLVYPAEGTLLPFSTKQRIGTWAKISGAFGLLFSSIFFFLPVGMTYGFYKLEQVSMYKIELKKDIEETDRALHKINEKLRLESE